MPSAVLMCQWFAPTKFVITTEGMDESIFVKDPKTGKVTDIKLPEKLVIISNHQVGSLLGVILSYIVLTTCPILPPCDQRTGIP